MANWTQVEPTGAFCSNGTPYKVFVELDPESNNVVFFFEGGGACWDYESCSGNLRSAANRDGLPDDYASMITQLGTVAIGAETVYPLLNSDPEVSPVAGWNKVFFPYCTGDIFAGSTTATYEDPEGNAEDLMFAHVGHSNVLATVEALRPMLPAVDRMLVSGCSAGGAGATLNYVALRDGFSPNDSALLADSGPIFPDQAASARSLPLHERVQASWNLEPLIGSLPSSDRVGSDFGAINAALAGAFPDDRLAVSFFQLDYNYSLYSYERFYRLDSNGAIEPLPGGAGPVGLNEDVASDRAAVYQLWFDDTELLKRQFDGIANLGYFLPYYRDTNDSHCTSVIGVGEFPQEELVARVVESGLREVRGQGPSSILVLDLSTFGAT